MTIEKEFLTRLFEDDNFIKDFYKNGGINRKADQNTKDEMMVKTAKKMGYSISIEGIKKASAEYFKSKGIWGAIKTFIHFNKIVKKVEKERK